jgi:hypothetical protein
MRFFRSGRRNGWRPVLIKGDLARAIRSREEEPVASRPVV